MSLKKRLREQCSRIGVCGTLSESKNCRTIFQQTRSSGISDFPLVVSTDRGRSEISTGVVLRACPDSQRE